MDFTASIGSPGERKKAELEQQWRLFERRLDYGLKFFDHHAKQRMSMFNFFLLFVGFIFAGYGALAKDGDFEFAATLAVLGAVLTVFFIKLERRNEELVDISEDLLLSLENDVLFKGYDKNVPWPHRRGKWRNEGGNVVFREAFLFPSKMNEWQQTRPSGIFRRQHQEQKEWGRSRSEHGYWLPRFQLAIMVAFVVLAVFSGLKWRYSSTPLPPREVATVPVFVAVPATVCPAQAASTIHGSAQRGRSVGPVPCK
jgi:hypothetical protein